ncbi:endonuclease/exonuclease/phosphatase family protein [Flavobacterium sp.]|uniref:endonuclease/exonuclease/phosphatase family protein n=1 Tax=Flavobacterium sp. TaxID=239 RepID=UPI00261A9ECA|nr:endonuclease/exonuclease/phosphatase family protein [Flavobacterium sp.]
MWKKSNFYVGILALLMLAKGWAQSEKFSVMTYNIRLDVASDGVNRWDNRKIPLLHQINTIHPDVLGVQEALPHQVIELQKGMPDYQKVGVGREENQTGEASCVFIKTSRFMIKDSGTFWLSSTPEKISRGWDAACNRVCSFVHLEDRLTGKKCWVFNTHWDHVGEQARTESLVLILAQIAVRNPKNEPVILMGDFNTTPEHPRLKLLKEDWVNSYTAMNPDSKLGTFNGFHTDKPENNYIDYIWVSRQYFKIHSSQILSEKPNHQWLSDHYPVVSIVEIKL